MHPLNTSFASYVWGLCAEYVGEHKSFDQINDATQYSGSSFFIVMQSDVLPCSEQLRFVTQPNLLDSFVKK